ncbi:hypothetical protein OAK17_09095, partial [Alphaproteobacteria bacterium]|nr:hypothetical protein [Alphaproteobacteria bacterium]
MLDIDLKKHKPPYLIHSDVFKTFELIKQAYLLNKNKINQCQIHFELLCNNFGIDNLILPSYNYDFSKTKVFNLTASSSHVGALSNYVISNKLLRRTKTPIFSFLTNIKALTELHSYPFSSGSVFD